MQLLFQVLRKTANSLKLLQIQWPLVPKSLHQTQEANIPFLPSRSTFPFHQVESNPFPFNYVANYTVSTEVASMEFRTENGTHIPISGLDDSLAITVAVNNGSNGAETGPEGAGTGGVATAGAVNISSCDSVIVRVSMGNTNRRAGLFVQLNFTSLQGERSLLFV